MLKSLLIIIATLSPCACRPNEPPGNARNNSSPARIITIAPNAAEIVCALGACNRIVGVSNFCVFPPELKEQPRVGGLFDADLEKIVTLQPDLVILRGKNESVENLCKKLNIRLYLDQTDKLSQIESCIMDFGNILKRKEQADILLAKFRNRIATIQRRVRSKKRPTVFVSLARPTDKIANVLTPGKGTFVDEMIGLAGGINAFGHLDMAYPQVSGEAIIAQRPDVIIELLPEIELTHALKRQMLAQWTKLGHIPAVANKRVHFVTDDNALIPSPRYVDIIEKVSRMLHPES